jgi:hypothetical protein
VTKARNDLNRTPQTEVTLITSIESSPQMSCTQLWLSAPSATVRIRWMDDLVCFINTGAMVSVVRPPIHASSQNKVDVPDPTVIVTVALNKSWEVAPTSSPGPLRAWNDLFSAARAISCVKPC